VRRMHLKEHPVLYDERPKELLDAVELINVRLSREEWVAINELCLQSITLSFKGKPTSVEFASFSSGHAC
jgi:hypothetical protein